jgi:flagellar protein FliJ
LKARLPESKSSQRIVDLAKFVFSLEALLQHKERIEQKERDELLRRIYNYQIELQNRDRLAVRLKETMEELGRKQAEEAASQELNWFYLYINRLRLEIQEAEKRLLQIESQVQEQKKVVIEASKKKKTLVSLKSKKEKEFVLSLEKQEQKEIDELVVTRYAGKA